MKQRVFGLPNEWFHVGRYVWYPAPNSFSVQFYVVHLSLNHPYIVPYIILLRSLDCGSFGRRFVLFS